MPMVPAEQGRSTCSVAARVDDGGIDQAAVRVVDLELLTLQRDVEAAFLAVSPLMPLPTPQISLDPPAPFVTVFVGVSGTAKALIMTARAHWFQ